MKAIPRETLPTPLETGKPFEATASSVGTPGNTGPTIPFAPYLQNLADSGYCGQRSCNPSYTQRIISYLFHLSLVDLPSFHHCPSCCMAILSSFRNRSKVSPEGKGSHCRGSLVSSTRTLLLDIALLFVSLQPSHAARNVTVDDVDPSIKYIGDEWKRIEGERSSSAPTFGGSWMSAWPQSTFIGRNSSYELNFEFSGELFLQFFGVMFCIDNHVSPI